jgi:hypothetical protein
LAKANPAIDRVVMNMVQRRDGSNLVRIRTLMPTGSQQVSGWKAQTKVAYQGFATESPTPFRPIPIC